MSGHCTCGVLGGLPDCYDGLCGHEDCVECNPSAWACPGCGQPYDDCRCDETFGGEPA
jgi:hypothetical protein